MNTLDSHYARACGTPSDIYQHLPTLKQYASECETNVELGVRGIVSTWALLAGRPRRLTSVDMIPPEHSGGNLEDVRASAKEAGIRFEFIQADDREIALEPTDLLFIDTWHVEEQLRAELALHAGQAQKYIALHDTATFGERGESPGHAGLLPALRHFLNETPEGKCWEIGYESSRCNGLTVLRRKRSRVKVFVFFYREEFLVPFFLSHYRWADQIHAFVSASPDRTRELLAAAPNVEIEDFEFAAGMDDYAKVKKLNEALAPYDGEHDWQLVLDSDEFIWPRNNPEATTVRADLSRVDLRSSVVVARMCNVFRHETDADLDPALEPVVLQRRHGIPGQGGENAPYQKPIVFRANAGVQFAIGNHAVNLPPSKICETYHFDGAHWGNADPAFCVARRVRDRWQRLSAQNIRLGLGAQHHRITEADVLAQCASHLKDPRCF